MGPLSPLGCWACWNWSNFLGGDFLLFLSTGFPSVCLYKAGFPVCRPAQRPSLLPPFSHHRLHHASFCPFQILLPLPLTVFSPCSSFFCCFGVSWLCLYTPHSPPLEGSGCASSSISITFAPSLTPSHSCSSCNMLTFALIHVYSLPLFPCICPQRGAPSFVTALPA